MPWWKSRRDPAAGDWGSQAEAARPIHGEQGFVLAAHQRNLSAEQLRDFLDWWMESMEARLLHFRDFVLPEGFPFDFSRESLYALADVLLDRYPTVQEVYELEDKDLHEGAVRYIGETHRRHYPGEWTVGTEPDTDTLGEVMRGLPADDPAWLGLVHEETVVVRDLLTAWESSMPAALAAVRAELSESDNSRLDLTPGSLVALGDIVLDRFATEEEFLHALRGGDPVAEGAVRYLGESIRAHSGAVWRFSPGPRFSIAEGTTKHLNKTAEVVSRLRAPSP